MKVEHSDSTYTRVTKIPKLQKKDASEYYQIRDELIKVLQKLGGYESGVDDIYLDEIARAVIYARKIEFYIDSNHATIDMYSRVTDMKLKYSKIIDDSIHKLALARRDRLGKQTESSLTSELREAILREMNASGDKSAR